MNKVFITGASGFVGTHLIEHLISLGTYEIFGTVFGSGENYLDKLLPKENQFPVNLLDPKEVSKVVKMVNPTHVVHLAALSSPSKSEESPLETITNNIGAQINLFESLIKLDQKPITIVIGSAEEYGIVAEKNSPIDELVPLNPCNPYAVSKITQDFLGLQYFYTHKLPVIRLRPFNHTGERRPPTFVLPAFAKQVAEIEAGKKEELIVEGDLLVERDFTDVKDMVRAYALALTNCQPGEVYNIGSGNPIKIADLLDILLSKSKVEVRVVKDESKQGKSSVKSLVCNYNKFKNATNWQPEIPLDQTVSRVLEYWRQITLGEL